jgi:hypothetical protein
MSEVALAVMAEVVAVEKARCRLNGVGKEARAHHEKYA